MPARVCFEGILIRLATGCSSTDVETLLGGAVSDTTLRARRDEWVAAGVFKALAKQAIDGFDPIAGLDLSEVGIDGSSHKALAAAKAPAQPLRPRQAGLQVVPGG